MLKTVSPQILSEEIKQLEEAIALKEREFLQQQQENSEFAEALRLLSTGVAHHVPEGRVLLMDQVNALLNEVSDQQDRQYRWDACQRALTVGQEAAVCLSVEIAQLRERLAIAESELDWQTNYQPFAERYKDGFVVPSPADIKAQKVGALQKDIADRQLKLERAQQWLSQPKGSRSYYAGDPLRETQYLGEAIPILSQQLERLIAEPIAQDAKYDQAFRQYVKARVAVEPTLAAFLQVQEEYLTALEQLKQAISQHPTAAEFPAVGLGQPRVVSGDGSIRLV